MSSPSIQPEVQTAETLVSSGHTLSSTLDEFSQSSLNSESKYVGDGAPRWERAEVGGTLSRRGC